MRDSMWASDRSWIEAGDVSGDHCCLVWLWMLRGLVGYLSFLPHLYTELGQGKLVQRPAP